MRRVARSDGQAAVELVAAIPLAVMLALVVAQLLAAGAARELAGHAAEAGAVGLLQGRDPALAARAALPGWSRAGVRVAVSGSRVRVRLRPRGVLPGAAELLVARAQADAGPQP